MMRCPFCKDGIEKREDGVRCKRCQAPHHLACWQEHGGRCSIYGCPSVEHKPLTAIGAARVVIAAGKHAIGGALTSARERLGGKSVVLLFLLSCFVPGLGLAPFLYHVHASRKVELEVVLASLFVILATWIATLLYRGVDLQDDLSLKVGERDIGSYYFFARGSGSGGSSSSGCSASDLGGCGGSSSSDLDGVIGGIILIVLAVIVIFVVLPAIAWLAVEVLMPCIVLAIYGTLYGALAFAVNKQEDLAGKVGPCVARALFYATIYTGLTGALIAAGYKLFHLYAPIPH